MRMHATEALVRAWYAAFDAGDTAGMLALAAADVVHEVNDAPRRYGRDALAAFMARMHACYAGRVLDLAVMVDTTGHRAAAEFTLAGIYRATDAGLPDAVGQAYRLPAGAFFRIDAGRIARVTTWYSLERWLAQVRG
jgi:steroid delta-isomerase-like uncharacterized protein